MGTNISFHIVLDSTQDIAEYMLYGVEGEALAGYTKEEATKLLKEELNI